MADVFISYHENSAGELAEQIADALSAAGISSWCARRDLPPGGNFAMNIPTQIHNCRLFLLILNEGVYQSNHIANEMGIAFSRYNKGENITILPVEIGDFTRKSWVEYYLIHTQSVKMPQPDKQNVEKLIRQITRIPGISPRKPQPTPTPAAQAQPVQPTRKPEAPPQSWQPQPAQLSPQPAQPSTSIIESGRCGDAVTYTLDSNGVLTISGVGPMRDYEYDADKDIITTPWYPKRDIISSVRIQEGVTSIGAWSFHNSNNLKSVTIPNSVTSIRLAAFHLCRQLKSVEIPNSVTLIEGAAFACCYNLASVAIPDSVAKIEWDAFRECKNLKSVSVPKKTSISESAGWRTFSTATQVIRRE